MASALTFDDEFNSLSLWNGAGGTWDTTAQYATWNGSGFSLPSNGEQEWYINSNYGPTISVQPWTVSNGVLTITAAPTSAAISPLIGGYQYTSGSINTSQSFSQTYGYFEMRAQLPAGQGMWPAFWLLPENDTWPPEIDAMEMLGNNPSVYYTSIHSGTASNEVNAGQADNVGNMSTGYHTFGVDWEPNFITYYFDGQQVYKVATPADMSTPMYMIANLAVGGTWPGNADATTPFPANMNVDWIRAYASLPSWIADGSDATDVGHTPANAVGGGGGSGSGSGSDPTADWQPTYTVASGITSVVLTGTSAQTITANNLGDTIQSNDYGSTLIGGTGNDTFIAGHGADTMTGGAGSDTFVFNVTPWNAGHITDFNVAADKLDLTGIFQTIGYTGTNPVADGYLSFVSDGVGNTLVYVNPHSASQAWPSLITTLNGISPASISSSDYIFSHSIAPTSTPLESFGSTELLLSGGNYYLDPVSGEVGPTLKYGGGVVTAGVNGGWNPIGVEATASGYEVAWSLAGQDQYVVWNTDANGNFSSIQNGLGGVSGTNLALEEAETSFHQDLNGDGTIGVAATVLESFGSTELLLSGGNYYLDPVSGGVGPTLKYGGSVVTAGVNGGWNPIGVEATASGYEVAWSLAGQDQYVVWNTDANGNFSSIQNGIGGVSGTNPALEGAEISFHQDLNDDGVISTVSTQDSASVYTVPSTIQTVQLTGTGSQTVTGNNFGDTILSNDYGSTLIGGTGNDTFVTGHGADMLTGGGGNDTFVFNYLPWNAGHITDFNPVSDVINLSGVFNAIGYTGSNPVADGYLSFESDGAGNMKIFVHPQGPATTIPITVTTLDHISPAQITSGDWIFHA